MPNEPHRPVPTYEEFLAARKVIFWLLAEIRRHTGEVWAVGGDAVISAIIMYSSWLFGPDFTRNRSLEASSAAAAEIKAKHRKARDERNKDIKRGPGGRFGRAGAAAVDAGHAADTGPDAAGRDFAARQV